MKDRFGKALLAIALLACLSAPTFSQPSSSLLTSAGRRPSVRVAPDATEIRHRIIKVDTSKVTRKGNQWLVIRLFQKQFVTIARIRQTRIGRNGFVWHGRISREPLSAVTISVVSKVMAANITKLNGEHYQIRYLGKGLHVLKQIDLSKYPPESPLSKTRPPKPRNITGEASGASAAYCDTDPKGQIDVSVTYTKAALKNANGYEGMLTLIYLAVEETNQAFINSQAEFLHLNLIYAGPISYTEPVVDITKNDCLNDKPWIATAQKICPNLIDDLEKSKAEILALNEQYHADCLVTILGYPAGVETNLAGYTDGFDGSKLWYSVINQSLSGQFTFTHELGHQLGAAHDCCDPSIAYKTDDGYDPPIGYNHGYVSSDKSWRTIMATSASCSVTKKENQVKGCNYTEGICTRIQYFSNPNILSTVAYPTLPSEPMGLAASEDSSCQADNYLALKDNELNVPNNSCSSPTAKDVWMKDTWHDTGAGPSVLVDGEKIWDSPYIWVRKDQDLNHIHEHQSEKPNFNDPKPNWIYVKMHNGGDIAAEGALEIFVHKASTGYLFPGDWGNVPLAKVVVNDFKPHSTLIVEAPWSKVQSDDYCLLARWVSATDPMTSPDTSNLVAYVLNNNNVIWRNLNNFDLANSLNAQAGFEFANPWNVSIQSQLQIVPALTMTGNSFLGEGRVLMHLDERLRKLWRAGGQRGTGFRLEGDDIILTSANGVRLTNLHLPPKFASRVQLTFNRLATTPKRTFRVDAIQYATRPRQRTTVLGGVSYEIHTDRIE